VTRAGEAQLVLEPQIVHAPEQPMTFSELQRGQRDSGDSKPQDGHFGKTGI